MGKTTRLKPQRLPEKLKQVRLRLGLSQNGLIRRMGFAGLLVQASISGYERHPRVTLPVSLAYARAHLG